MVIVPVIMNTGTFWIMDNFLKKSKFGKDDRNLQKFYVNFDEVQFDKIGNSEFKMEIEL